jgi:hypothetical protein
MKELNSDHPTFNSSQRAVKRTRDQSDDDDRRQSRVRISSSSKKIDHDITQKSMPVNADQVEKANAKLRNEEPSALSSGQSMSENKSVSLFVHPITSDADNEMSASKIISDNYQVNNDPNVVSHSSEGLRIEKLSAVKSKTADKTSPGNAGQFLSKNNLDQPTIRNHAKAVIEMESMICQRPTVMAAQQTASVVNTKRFKKASKIILIYFLIYVAAVCRPRKSYPSYYW